MTPTWPPKGYHTIATAAAALGVTPSRLYQILETAGLTLVQVGRAQLLTVAQVAVLRRRPRAKPGRKPNTGDIA